MQFETSKTGHFQREPPQFLNVISNAPQSKFPPEKNRYHLYVSLACPWACRTLMVRALKGLSDVIGVSVVHYYNSEKGWCFDGYGVDKGKDTEGVIPDTVNNVNFISELYQKTFPGYSGRITVPVLWDKKQSVIVNNESSQIIRMLNSEFNEFATNPTLDLYPSNLKTEIDAINEWIYHDINNGVYKCGFASTQTAYEDSFQKLFAALDRVEDILADHHWLLGNTFTEADVRLFTTLIRFDAVYFGHFKCNRNQLRDMPGIRRFIRRVYHLPEVTPTVHFGHIKGHYYMSHTHINPTQIIPLGPDLSYITSKEESVEE
eukprot:GCRY01002061.1.p1 GENE.GCRY01002061.1~~GCRY01002061.1.p1  ORF type:complete len:318 (+),score=46.11 GCRY01002061.1:257-1210(+)